MTYPSFFFLPSFPVCFYTVSFSIKTKKSQKCWMFILLWYVKAVFSLVNSTYIFFFYLQLMLVSKHLVFSVCESPCFFHVIILMTTSHYLAAFVNDALAIQRTTGVTVALIVALYNHWTTALALVEICCQQSWTLLWQHLLASLCIMCI